MQRVPISEDLPLAAPSGAGVLIGDAVREAGLDPALYLAVIPAECGMGGRVNLNGRIYVPEEVIAEHARVSREAAERTVAGEAGHPEAGPTWNIAVRFLGGPTRVREDGSVITEGRFGILRTRAGEDVFVCWQAGIPAGVSWKATALAESHTLTESSPYLAMNPGREGQTVTLMRELMLDDDAYDVVRVASAGTYLKTAESVQVREALQRITERQKTTEAAPPPEERAMTLKELQEKHPELFAAVRESVLTEAKVAEVPKLTEAVQKLTEERDSLRQQAVTLTEERQGLAEQVKTLTEERDAAAAKVARAELRDKVVEAIDAAIAGRPSGARIKGYLLADFDAGRHATAEDVTEALGRFLEVSRETQTAGGNAPTTEAQRRQAEPADEGGNPGSVTESAEQDAFSAFG